MITGWLLYCIAISALSAAAALAAESVLTRRGKPARWVWASAIAASLALPGLAFVIQQQTPAPLPRAGALSSAGSFEQRVASNARATPNQQTLIQRLPRSPEVGGADRTVVAIVILCIVLAGVRIAFDSALLFTARRRWTRGTMDGVHVLLSEDVGPAIVGLLEPAIVAPRWMLALGADERALMLAHEQEHVRANDGRLTTAALLAVMCAPWNPVIWWALRRLRTAIEIDCDRRVLSVHPNITSYAHLLVDVAQRAVGSSFAIAGFSERAAPLARRIRAMTPRGRASRWLDGLTVGASACAAMSVMLVLPPTAPARSVPQYAHSVRVLPKNVGDSIAEGETPPRVVAAATGLPPEFAVVEIGSADAGLPLAGRCAARLRDDRDGTRLLLSMSMTPTSDVVQRGDTSWTRITSFGFYHVEPVGRYGVGTDQTLRVGCGGFTRISVRDRDLAPAGTATLDSDDGQARRIAAMISSDLHVDVRAIELRRGRLNVFIDDSTVAKPGTETEFVRRTFAIAGSVVGAAALPETLAVSVHPSKDKWMTMYFYASMMK